MPKEDFVGRWIADNDRRATTTIEVELVEGLLAVRAINNADGELATIIDLKYTDDSIHFTAQWSSGQSTTYRLLRSNEKLVVHFTISDTNHFTRDLNADGTQKWRSGILHIMPGQSSAGSLRYAVRASGRTDHVLGFQDDLSCGPIDSKASSARSSWWASMHSDRDIDLDYFWRHIASTSDRLVVWFGRYSAQEHAFFLSLVDRLGDRPYDIIDVTGLRMPLLPGPDGKPRSSRPKQCVSLIGEDDLASLFGMERTMTPDEKDAAAQTWRQLKSESASFRIVTEAGLVSAPVDVFDGLILAQATKDWRRAARVIGETMGSNMEPYIQVGDMMLLSRIAALVEQGKLLAHGDPWDMRKCDVRLPD